MVAALAPTAAPRLLVEPLMALNRHGEPRLLMDGSRLRVRGERTAESDAHGAMVQEIICRYYLGGVRRGVLARRYGYQERQVQTWLVGDGAVAYSRPLLGALRGLGFPIARRLNVAVRHELIAAALRVVLAEVIQIAQMPGQRGHLPAEIARDVRLLSTDWSREQ